jgi:hypothetical protein
MHDYQLPFPDQMSLDLVALKQVGEDTRCEQGGVEATEPAAASVRQAFVSEVSRSALCVAAREASVVDSPPQSR